MGFYQLQALTRTSNTESSAPISSLMFFCDVEKFCTIIIFQHQSFVLTHIITFHVSPGHIYHHTDEVYRWAIQKLYEKVDNVQSFHRVSNNNNL